VGGLPGRSGVIFQKHSINRLIGEISNTKSNYITARIQVNRSMERWMKNKRIIVSGTDVT